MSAVHPCFSAIVEELHGHKQPALRSLHQADEFDAPAVAPPTLSDEVGPSQHVRHVLETEPQPCRPPLPDVADPVRRNEHGAFDSREGARQCEVVRHESGELDPVGLRKDFESMWHPRDPNWRAGASERHQSYAARIRIMPGVGWGEDEAR